MERGGRGWHVSILWNAHQAYMRAVRALASEGFKGFECGSCTTVPMSQSLSNLRGQWVPAIIDTGPLSGIKSTGNMFLVGAALDSEV